MQLFSVIPQRLDILASPTFAGLTLNGDIVTDRWLSDSANTFLGEGVCGAGNLEHPGGSTGYYNTALGYNVLYDITSGYSNTAIGYRALTNLTSGNNNIAIGDSAGFSLSTGSSNISLGYMAGYNQTTLDSRLIIDNQDRGSAANEITKSLIYGIFAATPADQTLRFNANVGININPGRLFDIASIAPVMRLSDTNATNVTQNTGFVEFGFITGGWSRCGWIGFGSLENDILTINNVAGSNIALMGANVGINVTDPHSKLEVNGAISSATSTFSTVGPTDDVDVSGINTLFIDNSSNAVTIGGFSGGVDGQVLYIALINPGDNDVTLEHNHTGATQKIFLHAGADETLNLEYGGWVFVCHGGVDWHDCSHEKHAA